MDNYLGDLADIVRASGGAINNINTTTTATTATSTIDQISCWDFGSPDTTNELQDLYTFPDSLVHDMDTIPSPRPLLNMVTEDNNNNNNNNLSGRLFSNNSNGPMQISASAPNNHLSNIFSSRMVQISPTRVNNSNRVKLPIHAASVNVVNKSSFEFMPNEMISINASCSTTGLEIPSPRNSGMKRR